MKSSWFFSCLKYCSNLICSINRIKRGERDNGKHNVNLLLSMFLDDFFLCILVNQLVQHTRFFHLCSFFSLLVVGCVLLVFLNSILNECIFILVT